MKSVVIHAHFYQPPREDPWLDEIEPEREAEPYHDWTTRVAHECYRGVVAARVLDGEGRIRRVVNALAHTSFDVGASLLAWLERRMPNVYGAVLDADRASAERTGFGNAIALPYEHLVLPLASRRDKLTAVRWGIDDFTSRFGRAPLGMWLPETAVDDETLDVLAECDVRFTILAPHQILGLPAGASVGRYTTTNGRTIALCAYDATLTHDVAFGGLLRDGRRMAEQLAAPNANGEGGLALVATDGETYGHHHRFGDMALGAAVDALDRHPRARIENLAAFLARVPAETDVTLLEPSSWSCPHGVERWRADCGCAVESGLSHAWRAPLREAIDGLVADAHTLVDGAQSDALGGDRARTLDEIERQALRAQTSSAWFFDDLSRPEVLVVLRAAARAIELARDLAPADAAAIEARFVERLARAQASDARVGSAREVYATRARPARPAAIRVAAGYAAVRRFGAPDEAALPATWSAESEEHLVRLVERRTGRAWTLEVLVDVPGAGIGPHVRLADVDPRAITVLVRELRGAGAPEAAPLGTALKLGDLPQRAREAIERALRRAVVHRLLDEDERERLAAGEAELGFLVSAALRRSIGALAHDTSPAAIARVLGLVDLRDALRGVPPFDAQTLFHEIRRGASAETAARLAPVARRLGFSPRAWE